MILLLALLVSLQPTGWCWTTPKLTDLESALQWKLHAQPLQRNIRNAFAQHTEQIASVQYELMLRKLNIQINATVDQPTAKLARVRSNGRFYRLIGNSIEYMVINRRRLQWVYLISINDITDEVQDFAIEEIDASESKKYSIATLYLEDRIQVYQISANSSQTIKSIQKIRRPGNSTRTVLVHFSSALYLITGYTEQDSGKVAVYRWLDYHFSVEDIKEVSRHDDLIVYGNKQLVILVLDFAQYPERSMNHVYVLNEQRKLVKTQEMYFLSNRMPHYVAEDDLYVLRCLAPVKCFLYKWNGENLFLRVSKISFNVADITLFESGYEMMTLLFNGEVYLYYNQPLLKLASSYTITSEQGLRIADRMLVSQTVSHLVIYKEITTGQLYLILTKGGVDQALELFEIQMNARQRTDDQKDGQESFNVLKTCLSNIKNSVNTRKRWIDLMKFKMNQTIRGCKTSALGISLATNKLFVYNTNYLENINLKGLVKSTSATIMQKWNAVKNELLLMYTRSRDLFYLNKKNSAHGNIKVRGNLHAANTRMEKIRISEPKVSWKRFKRDSHSARSLTVTTVNARNVVHNNGKLFKNTVSKKMKRLSVSALHSKNIHSSLVHSRSKHINNIFINDVITAKSNHAAAEKGLKVFQFVKSTAANISHMSNENDHYRLSTLSNLVAPDLDKTVINLSGTKVTRNLVIDRFMADISIRDLLQQLYYVDGRSFIASDVYLRAPSKVKNVYSEKLNTFNTVTLFDLRTNQTVSASIHMHKTYASDLHSRHVNKLSIPQNTTLIGDTKLIKTALATKFVVLGNLTLSTDNHADNSRHVLGTNIEDLSQIYTGRVFLKGSLTVGSMDTNRMKTQMSISDLNVGPHIARGFWMKHLAQEIPAFSFHRGVVAHHMLCRNLNYHAIADYMHSTQWKLLAGQELSKARVQGNLKLFAKAPAMVQQIYSETVYRGSLATMSGKKTFVGKVRTDLLASDFVDFVSVNKIVFDTAFAWSVKSVKRAEHMLMNNCIVSVHKKCILKKMWQNSLAAIVDSIANTRDVQKIGHMAITELKSDHFQAALINKLVPKQFAAEVSTFTEQIDPVKQLFVENLIVKMNVIATNRIVADYVNKVALAEYFMLLALKRYEATTHREIGGSKLLQQGIVVDNRFSVLNINHHNINYLLHNVAQKSNTQITTGLWFANTIKTKYLTTKAVNSVPIKHLLNANLQEFIINQNLLLETMVVAANINGNILPKAAPIVIPSTFTSIANLVTYGSFLLQNPQPATLLFDLLAYSSVQLAPLEQKVIFHGESTYVAQAWNEATIISKARKEQFQSLLNSAIRKQALVVFRSTHERTLQNVICLETATASASRTSIQFVNGVKVIGLGYDVHTEYEGQRVIRSTKHFQQPPNAAHLLCSHQLAPSIYPYHLQTVIDQPLKTRYVFGDSVDIIGTLYVDTINDYSVNHFLENRAIKNRRLSRNGTSVLQHMTGWITFNSLVLSGSENMIQTINGIPLHDVASEVLGEHQMLLESKRLKGRLVLFGPTSIAQCNGHSLIEALRLTFWLQAPQISSRFIDVEATSTVLGGVAVSNMLNRMKVHENIELKLSSAEELLPLIPRIRGQLSASSRIHSKQKQQSRALRLIENPILNDGHNSTHNPDNSTLHVHLKDVVLPGVRQINLTVSENLHDSASTRIPGTLVHAKWASILFRDQMQLIVITMVKQDLHLALISNVYRKNSFAEPQVISVSTNASFRLLFTSDESIVVTISELSASVVSRFQLLRYDANGMKFVPYKTFMGPFSTIDAVVVDATIMLLLVKENSDVLEIYTLADSVSVLYQQIVFDVEISSVEPSNINGDLAVRVMTENNMTYIYTHSFLSGWKQKSYSKKRVL